MTRTSTLFVLLLAVFSNSFAQSTWQWGKKAGSPWDVPTPDTPDDMGVSVTTDRNGNVYVLSSLVTPTLTIDGHPKSGWDNTDVVLTSFKCDGTYRWSKLIGGHSLDYAVTVKTDTMNGVYISGYVFTNSSAIGIDTDSTWTTSLGSAKGMFLAKFDTSGAYKWFRMPQPDTISGWMAGQTSNWDMDVDGGGNIYWLVSATPGLWASGAFPVTTQGQYILQYNSNGFFVSGTKLQFTLAGSGAPGQRMKRDHNSGKYYVTGDPPFFTAPVFGSTTITHTLYIGCFSSTGSLLWLKQNTNNFSNGPISRPAIDAAGNIYVTAQAVHNDTFCNYVVSNAGDPNGTVMAVKIDPSGNLVWGSNARSISEEHPWTLTLNGNELAVTGSYGGYLKWGSDSIQNIDATCTGGGYSPFIARLNTTTGVAFDLDSLKGLCGSDVLVNGITAGKTGNYYLTGQFGSSVTIAGTVFNTVGGETDMFLAKFGTNDCSATTPPPPTDVAAPLIGSDLLIRPNPATDLLIIENAGTRTQVRLFNILGQQVYSGMASNGTLEVNTTNLIPGNYLLQLTDTNGNRVSRMVVKQ